MTAGTTAKQALAASPYVTIVGIVGLATVVLVGFEEPHWGMLLLFAVVSAAAPVALAIHLLSTKELTEKEKQLWARGLTSWKTVALFPAYFSTDERQRTTQKLRERDQSN